MSAKCLGVKEEPCMDFVEVDKIIYPRLHNQIGLGNNILHNLLDYRNKYIKKLLVKENVTPEEGKEHHSLKSIIRRYMTPTTTMTYEIIYYDFKIDELKKKREIHNNDVYNIKIHNYKLK